MGSVNAANSINVVPGELSSIDSEAIGVHSIQQHETELKPALGSPPPMDRIRTQSEKDIPGLLSPHPFEWHTPTGRC